MGVGVGVGEVTTAGEVEVVMISRKSRKVSQHGLLQYFNREQNQIDKNGQETWRRLLVDSTESRRWLGIRATGTLRNNANRNNIITIRQNDREEGGGRS